MKATKTFVKFLIEKENDGTEGGVFAYFPYLKADYKGNKLMYTHVGQHGACSPLYAKECRYATETEYQRLKKELEDLEYDLIVLDGIKTIDKILYKVDTSRGAPMGRYNVGTKPTNKKIYDCKVNLIDGYDKNGAYFGCPNNLRVAYTKDLSYINFYRTN
jgi:hypothetical protein